MDSIFSPTAESRAGDAAIPDVFDAAQDAGPSFLDRLFDQGLLVRTGVDGLYGRSGAFESVVDALDRHSSRVSPAQQLPPTHSAFHTPQSADHCSLCKRSLSHGAIASASHEPR